MWLLTNIIDLYFSSYYKNEDYYSLLVQSGDFQSRNIDAYLWYNPTNDANALPYNIHGKLVVVNYKYINSSGEIINTDGFNCSMKASEHNNLISFVIPNICLMSQGDVFAQIKVYENEYSLLNTCVFKIQVLESINIGDYSDNQFPIFGFLRQATESELGGIKATEKDENDTIEAKIDTESGKLYVAPNVYTLPQATDSILGGIKAASKGDLDTIEAKIDETSGKLYVAPSMSTCRIEKGSVNVTILNGASYGSATVTFSVAFSETPAISVVISGTNPSGRHVGVSAVSASQMTVVVGLDAARTSDGTYTVIWGAIGL